MFCRYIIEVTNKVGGDICFRFGNNKIKGIKSLLSAVIPQFQNIFEEEPDSDQFVITSELVSLIGLEAILKYFGYGIISLNEDNIYNIICCSIYFHIADIIPKLLMYTTIK